MKSSVKKTNYVHCGEKDEDLLLSLKYNFHLCLSNARVIVKEVGTVVSNSYVLLKKINVTKTGTYFLSHTFWYKIFEMGHAVLRLSSLEINGFHFKH